MGNVKRKIPDFRNHGTKDQGADPRSTEYGPGHGTGSEPGTVLSNFPPIDSPLRLEQFFTTLYLRYDERYVFSAPKLKAVTQRLEWSPASPAFEHTSLSTFGYNARLSAAPAS